MVAHGAADKNGAAFVTAARLFAEGKRALAMTAAALQHALLHGRGILSEVILLPFCLLQMLEMAAVPQQPVVLHIGLYGVAVVAAIEIEADFVP